VIDIGPWKYVTFLAVFLYFGRHRLTVRGVDRRLDDSLLRLRDFMSFPSNAVLNNYYTVLKHPSFVTGLYNSLVLSVTIAVVTVLAGIVMAFTIHRTRAVGTKIFEFIGTLPLAFPPLVLSVGLVIIFLGTPLYNSLWALGIGLFVAYFPYAFRNASGSIVNIHKELDEAARCTAPGGAMCFQDHAADPQTIGGRRFLYLRRSDPQRRCAVLARRERIRTGHVVEYFRVGQWAERRRAA
jgi:iron(III) transport system permease protein